MPALCWVGVQSCLTLCDPMDCSPPGSWVHGILQARILEWVAMPSSRDPSDPGIEPTSPMSPALQADSSPLALPGKPLQMPTQSKKLPYWSENCWFKIFTVIQVWWSQQMWRWLPLKRQYFILTNPKRRGTPHHGGTTQGNTRISQEWGHVGKSLYCSFHGRNNWRSKLGFAHLNNFRGPWGIRGVPTRLVPGPGVLRAEDSGQNVGAL